MKRSRLRPVSGKRAALMVQRRHLVKEILERRPNCEARLEGCSGRSVDVHERLNRSQGGKIVGGEPADYMALCRSCHRFITDHPKIAYELGYSIHRW